MARSLTGRAFFLSACSRIQDIEIAKYFDAHQRVVALYGLDFSNRLSRWLR